MCGVESVGGRVLPCGTEGVSSRACPVVTLHRGPLYIPENLEATKGVYKLLSSLQGLFSGSMLVF